MFAINPVSPTDSIRNPSPAPSLRGRHGSQLSLRLPSHSISSGNRLQSGGVSPSRSSAVSASSLSLYAPDPPETVDGPRRQETQPPGIEVIEPPSPTDSQTSSYNLGGAPSVLSAEPVDGIWPKQPSSDATLYAQSPYTQGPSTGSYLTSKGSRLTYTSKAEALTRAHLTPAVPSETRRYTNRKKIAKEETNIILSPHDCDNKRFHRDVVLPPGWTRLSHPEGGCYFKFYHPALGYQGIYTDTEIYDPDKLEQIEAKIDAIEFLQKTIDNFPPSAHIVLNIYGDEPGDTQCYCVNHDDRLIFFLSHFHTEWLQTWGEVKGAYSRRHLLHELEAQYWHFVQLYPDSIKLSQRVIGQLKDDLIFFSGDVITSPYSTSPYNSVEIRDLLDMLPTLEGHVNCETPTPGAVEFIARHMMLICHNRFLNFYGEPCARLERDFSVYGDALFPRTPLLRSVSLLLFSAPDVHLTSLQKMWVDEMLHKGVWKETMNKFASEWQELVAFATIMLNANVAFLAIQSIDKPAPSRSWAQIFSYASTTANLACMMLGLLLTRQNRTKRQETAELVYKYLKKQYSELTGLEALAIMFSLPHAALMWGMVSFSVAFSLMCLSEADAQTRIVVTGCLTLASAYIIWCIYLAWETNPKDISQDNRHLAYIQMAELDKVRKENELRAQEMKEAMATGNSGSHESSGPEAATASSATLSRPPPRVPGVESIMTLWNGFLHVFMRPESGSHDEETGQITGIELRNQAQGGHT